MEKQNPEQKPRVLVVAAHPDDPEFACGGTSARWAREGKEVHYLVCTRGDKGSADAGMTSEKLVEIREEEQRAAAAVLGVKSVTFLDFRDGELEPTRPLRGAIVRAIRTIRPDVVFTHDPTTVYTDEMINHPDHRAVGTATLDSVYPTARDRLQFPEHEAEGLEPHKVLQVMLWGSQAPNVWVDIGETFCKKLESLRRHQSQVGAANGLEERLRERAHRVGEPQGIDLAEAFRQIKLAR